MRQQLPKEIDPFRFANNGRQLEGELALANMSRLGESLHDKEGVVQVSMQFEVDQTGTPYMQGHFATTLSLTCERCMQELKFPVELDSLLGLVKHEKLITSLAEQYEPWVIDDSELVDPATVVEDELILALPLVPKHDYDCLPEEAWFAGDKEIEENPEKPESPFAVLSALKSKK
jgi:uncharacterized protein